MYEAVYLVLFLGIALTLIAATPNDRDFVPRGTEIRVHTEGPVTVAKWDRGRIYQAVIERDVRNQDGDVLIPRGANCEMIVGRSLRSNSHSTLNRLR